MKFEGKKILAPMVRFSTLPTRMLALEYDFDIVYGPEIYTKPGPEKILNFATTKEERSRLVFQLGCSNPELAIKAAQTIKQDVDVIDLNCGCPKPFSLKGKMGAALLEDPDLLCNILTALKSEVPQVTCKIRVFDDMDKTLELVKRINATGISALAVHARTKDCKSDKTKARWDYFQPIKQVLGSTPLIANGDVFSHRDMVALKELGCDSFMTARGAMRNLSMFRTNGNVDSEDICKAYLKKALKYNNNYQNTKWVLLSMYPYTTSSTYRKWTKGKSLAELCSVVGISSTVDNSDPKYDSEFPYVPNPSTIKI